jgi:quercetin dioxygenase-like cupin family protein
MLSEARGTGGEVDAMSRPHEDNTEDKFTGGNALELATYQAGAVVSREIIKKKAGTVTVFAFDKGEGLSEHTAPFDALVHVLDGVAEITIGGTPHRVGKDEMIIMPAHVPHALNAVERFKMMLVMIREPAS